MEEYDRQYYSVVEEYSSPWLKFHLGLPASKRTGSSRPPERQARQAKQQLQHLHRSSQFQAEKTLERSRGRQHQQLSLRLNAAGKIKPTVVTFPRPCADYGMKVRRRTTHGRSGKNSDNNAVLITVDPYRTSSYRAQSVGTDTVQRANTERGRVTSDRGKDGSRSRSAGFGTDDDGSVKRNRKRAMELVTTTPVRLLGMIRSMENNRELNWRSGKENNSRRGSVHLPLITGARTKEAMRAYGMPTDGRRDGRPLSDHDHAVRFDVDGRNEEMVFPDFWRAFSSESLPTSWKYSNSVHPTVTISAGGVLSSSSTWAGFEPHHDLRAPIDETENNTDDVDHSITVSIFKRKEFDYERFATAPESDSVRANRCDEPPSKTPAATAEEFVEDNVDYDDDVDKSACDDSLSDSDKEYAADDNDNDSELMTLVESEFSLAPSGYKKETAKSGPRGNFYDGLHLGDEDDDIASNENDEGFDQMEENEEEAEETSPIVVETRLLTKSETVNRVELSDHLGRLYVVQGPRDVEIREEQTVELGGEIGVDVNNNSDGITENKYESREDAIDGYLLDSIRRDDSSEARENDRDKLNDAESEVPKTAESESLETSADPVDRTETTPEDATYMKSCVLTEHDDETVTASELLRKTAEPTGNVGTSETSDVAENSTENVNVLESPLSHLDSCAENVENDEDIALNENFKSSKSHSEINGLKTSLELCGGPVEAAGSRGKEDPHGGSSAGRMPYNDRLQSTEGFDVPRFSALEIIPAHLENGSNADGDSDQSDLPVSPGSSQNESKTCENNAGQTSKNSEQFSTASPPEKASGKGSDKVTDPEGNEEANDRAENDSSPVKAQRKRSVRFSVATVYRYEALSPRDGGEITDHEDNDEGERRVGTWTPPY